MQMISMSPSENLELAARGPSQKRLVCRSSHAGHRSPAARAAAAVMLAAETPLDMASPACFVGWGVWWISRPCSSLQILGWPVTNSSKCHLYILYYIYIYIIDTICYLLSNMYMYIYIYHYVIILYIYMYVCICIIMYIIFFIYTHINHLSKSWCIFFCQTNTTASIRRHFSPTRQVGSRSQLSPGSRHRHGDSRVRWAGSRLNVA